MPRSSEGIIAHKYRRWQLKRRFRRYMGHTGNFEAPQSYQEKVHFRKLYGNHAFYASVADKYAVRRYVAERVGEQYLVPLYGVYDRLSCHDFRDLPNQFIIKANHGSGWNKTVLDKADLDEAATVEYFNSLMSESYGRRLGEIHYEFIEPKIIIEKLLFDGEEFAAEYDLFCYHNDEGFDYCISVSAPGNERHGHFDKHWNLLDSNLSDDELARFANPKNFGEIVDVAERLSRGFDFLRVDLFNFEGHIYFCEATCTPGGGVNPIANPIRQKMRSDMWKLDIDNKQLYRRPKAA